VTSFLLEHFRAPSGTRDLRAFESARNRTLAELAGRTVWCVGGAAAQRLRRRLQWAVDAGIESLPLRLPEAEDLVEDVRQDDIVVVHHPLTAARADAIRERGAHAVWHVVAPREPAPAIDAYLMTGRTADGAQIVAAVMPRAGIVAAKEIQGGSYRDVGWTSLLADVVRTDRDECVGGTLHARPAVAPR
jgi:hypothetical protein